MNGEMLIDAVVTWVDGNDPVWQEERNKYNPNKQQDGSANRYRDWDLLKYWFRGIEKFAPWFNKIYFVTWGHLPTWLDISNPKIRIVKHSDYISQEYLPTFSSRTIEMNVHRISGLSEHFVYFNDDMFLIKPVKASHFFKKGLPCDMAVLKPISYDKWTIGLYTKLNELIVIGEHFNKRDCIKKNFTKFFNLKYGKYLIENICNMLYSNFTGFRCTHSPYPFLKKTFDNVWENAYEIMDETCKTSSEVIAVSIPGYLNIGKFVKGILHQKMI